MEEKQMSMNIQRCTKHLNYCGMFTVFAGDDEAQKEGSSSDDYSGGGWCKTQGWGQHSRKRKLGVTADTNPVILVLHNSLFSAVR